MRHLLKRPKTLEKTEVNLPANVHPNQSAYTLQIKGLIEYIKNCNSKTQFIESRIGTVYIQFRNVCIHPS